MKQDMKDSNIHGRGGGSGKGTVNLYSLAAFQQVYPDRQPPLEKVGGNGLKRLLELKHLRSLPGTIKRPESFEIQGSSRLMHILLSLIA